MRALVVTLGLCVLSAPVRADDAENQPVRRRDASWSRVFAGPFTSPRLFAMPVADVVGAFQLSVSYDGSLLQEPGVLSSAGVVALGFGDIAQLEYRHTSVISIEDTTAPVPAVGVQMKLPIPERMYVPAFAIAFRLGVPREEVFGDTTVDETVTDLYIVSRLRMWGALERVTLHAGIRVSSAKIEIGGARDGNADKRLLLPTVGVEVRADEHTRFVAEIALAPAFDFEPLVEESEPLIGEGVLARLGIRWHLLPSFAFDASLGYQIEAPSLGGTMSRGADAVVDWDIRLGGEVFIPWGAMSCRVLDLFCE
jgi:hypothetical protein